MKLNRKINPTNIFNKHFYENENNIIPQIMDQWGKTPSSNKNEETI